MVVPGPHPDPRLAGGTRLGVVIPAAGRGERLGAGRPKALIELAGRPLVVWALEAVLAAVEVAEAVVVAPPDELRAIEHAVAAVARPGVAVDGQGAAEQPQTHVVVRVVVGGATRQESVAAGLATLSPDITFVLVHDAARPLVPPHVVRAVVAALEQGDVAVVPGLALVDTVKEVDAEELVVATPDRSRLRAVQTPQGFSRQVLQSAHAAATNAGRTDASDDAGLVELAGHRVRVVPGDAEAFKVTRPLDLRLAELLVAAQSATAAGGSADDAPSGSGDDGPQSRLDDVPGVRLDDMPEGRL